MILGIDIALLPNWSARTRLRPATIVRDGRRGDPF